MRFLPDSLMGTFSLWVMKGNARYWEGVVIHSNLFVCGLDIWSFEGRLSDDESIAKSERNMQDLHNDTEGPDVDFV
jgi:hypothetical protein